jgi:hypothetical protein
MDFYCLPTLDGTHIPREGREPFVPVANMVFSLGPCWQVYTRLHFRIPITCPVPKETSASCKILKVVCGQRLGILSFTMSCHCYLFRI